jgi:trehalose 6-phosphate synthase
LSVVPSAFRFVLILCAVLGLLAWGAAELLGSTSWRWFERDVRSRAELALAEAREPLTRALRAGDHSAVKSVLAELRQEGRVMAAEACGPDLSSLARVGGVPRALSCEALAPRLRAGALSETQRHDRGSIHLSANPIRDGERTLGYVVLIHDLSFADRRDALTWQLTLAAFLVLAIAGSALAVLVARSSFRSWLAGVRAILRGQKPSVEFRPHIHEVRALLDEVAAEANPGTPGLQPWTPARLKETLKTELSGEKVLVVANREPYIHERRPDGSVEVMHPASGMVTALEPVMRACSGVWIAHGSGSADRESADRQGRLWVPPGERSYQLRRVWLTPEEEKGYYYGFANEGLWPLCHIAHARPAFRREDFEHYKRVNQKFADAVVSEADSDDPIVLVQDYHFALAPRMIRQRLPRATILTFWHIPWPNAERFGICPFHQQLVEGLLGSSIVGFHIQQHCNNFLEAADRFLEARVDREQFAVVQKKSTTLVRPYPISIEWPNRYAESAPSVPECRAQVRAELGLRPDALLGVGVDRLDYTKGIEERLQTVERLLERSPHLRGRFTFVQAAAPSRTIIERYRDLNTSVEQLAARINERFGSGDYRPVILLRTHHEAPAVFRMFRAADVCYVSSLHDGMNLVAKEFVAARDDLRGVLVLSSFTGAARELTEALVVNPYDLDEAAGALAAALEMTPDEQSARMAAMRSLVRHFNVYRWAGRMLIDASQLRRRDRIIGRLPERLGRLAGARG